MSRTCIAIDAMGGDDAPRVPVEGACLAAGSFDVSIALVGQEARIKAELERLGFDPAENRITVVDAPEWIEMGESPATALRTKRKASVLLAAEMVAEGKAQAMLSAGNSGAAMGAAMWKMGTLQDIERPAIAVVVPHTAGEMIFLDAGATVDCRAHNILQFGQMGAAYARCRLELDAPRVGLLSIGEEASKGNALTNAAHKLLEESDLNFIGNIEPHEMMHGSADVVVCDGFVGNIALKTMESMAEFVMRFVMHHSGNEGSVNSEKGGLLDELKKKIDWAEYGGALLLGVKGICIISHGRSTPAAMARAVGVAHQAVEKQVLASFS